MSDEITFQVKQTVSCELNRELLKLNPSKADILFSKFGSYASYVDEWKDRLYSIVVQDDTQVEAMEKAKEARQYIKKLRIDLEKERKTLKEEALREGQSIDNVARNIRTMLERLEEHLDKQENFTKYRIQEEQRLLLEKIRIENEIKAKEEEEKARAKAEEERLLEIQKTKEAMEKLQKQNAELQEKLKRSVEMPVTALKPTTLDGEKDFGYGPLPTLKEVKLLKSTARASDNPSSCDYVGYPVMIGDKFYLFYVTEYDSKITLGEALVEVKGETIVTLLDK